MNCDPRIIDYLQKRYKGQRFGSVLVVDVTNDSDVCNDKRVIFHVLYGDFDDILKCLIPFLRKIDQYFSVDALWGEYTLS